MTNIQVAVALQSLPVCSLHDLEIFWEKIASYLFCGDISYIDVGVLDLCD